jgi:hypothetical protein
MDEVSEVVGAHVELEFVVVDTELMVVKVRVASVYLLCLSEVVVSPRLFVVVLLRLERLVARIELKRRANLKPFIVESPMLSSVCSGSNIFYRRDIILIIHLINFL